MKTTFQKPFTAGKIIAYIIFLAIVFIVVSAYYPPLAIPAQAPAVITHDEASDYLKLHISELSPQKPVLGGNFYVASFILNGTSSGIVMYEDGHVAYSADVVFQKNNDGTLKVTSFAIRDQNNQPPNNI